MTLLYCTLRPAHTHQWCGDWEGSLHTLHQCFYPPPLPPPPPPPISSLPSRQQRCARTTGSREKGTPLYFAEEHLRMCRPCRPSWSPTWWTPSTMAATGRWVGQRGGAYRAVVPVEWYRPLSRTAPPGSVRWAPPTAPGPHPLPQLQPTRHATGRQQAARPPPSRGGWTHCVVWVWGWCSEMWCVLGVCGVGVGVVRCVVWCGVVWVWCHWCGGWVWCGWVS